MVMGQSDKALEMLDGLQAYLPGDAKLMEDYGEVYVMTGQLAESRKYFQQAYEKEPKDTVNPYMVQL